MYKLHKIDKEEPVRLSTTAVRETSEYAYKSAAPLLDGFFGVSEGGCRPQRSPTCGLLSYIHVRAFALPLGDHANYSVSLGSFLAL